MTLATDEILRDALHWDMLKDLERNSAYQQALTVAVSERRKTAGFARVFDVGAGVGLLSLMAVSAGADKVVGCEANRETARLARKIVGRNGLQEKIEILDVHSTAVSPDEVGSVDVCVAEIFDSELLGEGMLRTISDVGRRLVGRNCRFIPASATVWAEPVTSPTLFRSLRYPGQRGSVVVPQTVLNCPSLRCPVEWRVDQLPTGTFRSIGAARRLFHFDLAQLYREESFAGRIEVVSPTNGCDTVDAWLLYWTLDMSGNSSVVLSSRGNESQSRFHWLPCLYPVDGQSNEVFTLFHDEFSIWVEPGSHASPTGWGCNCGVHTSLSRLEIGRLNHSFDRSEMENFCLRHLADRNSLLFIGNFSFLPLVAAQMGSESAVFLTTNAREAELMRMFATANNVSSKLSCVRVESLEAVDQIVSASPDCLVSCFSGAEPWQILHFFQVAHNISTWQLDSPSLRIFPKSVQLMCMALDIKDFDAIRVTSMRGMGPYDMSLLSDMVIRVGDTASSDDFQFVHLWELNHLAVSLPQRLCEVDVSLSDSAAELVLPTKWSAGANAVAFWLECSEERQAWWCPGVSSDQTPVGVGLKPQWSLYHRQAVLPVRSVAAGESLRIEAKFQAETGSFQCCVGTVR